MALVKAVHHVSIKCENDEQYRKAVELYTKVIGLTVKARWNNPDGECIMMDTGCGVVEILHGAKEKYENGLIEHFAFTCDDLDACLKACTDAGCPILVQPKELAPGGYKIRIAFVRGAAGEQIEFVQEL